MGGSQLWIAPSLPAIAGDRATPVYRGSGVPSVSPLALPSGLGELSVLDSVEDPERAFKASLAGLHDPVTARTDDSVVRGPFGEPGPVGARAREGVAGMGGLPEGRMSTVAAGRTRHSVRSRGSSRAGTSSSARRSRPREESELLHRETEEAQARAAAAAAAAAATAEAPGTEEPPEQKKPRSRRRRTSDGPRLDSGQAPDGPRARYY